MRDDYGAVPPQLVLAVAGAVLILFLLMFAIFTRIKKCPPNELMVLSGMRRPYIDDSGKRRSANFRVLKGGATFVWPFIERMDTLPLSVIDLDLGTIEVLTSDGSQVRMKCSSQVKADTSTESSIVVTVENLTGKTEEEIEALARNMLEGRIHTALGNMTGDVFDGDREGFYNAMQSGFVVDTAKIGLQVLNFSLYVEM